MSARLPSSPIPLVPHQSAATASAWAAADGLLAQRGHSFHWSRRLLNSRHAERATRLYGWCRLMDDLADEGTSPAAASAALAAVRLALQTGRTDDPATRDMLLLMRECSISSTIPLDMIQGIESDLGDVRITDLNTLLGYAYRVAGTVGLMMTAALDVVTPEALPHAIDLGIAMQLTNVCRDVQADALIGRRYLPASLVGDVEPAALVAPVGVVREKAQHALRTLLDVADRHYASGEQGLRHLPAGARAGILVAARAYREIGVVLRKRDYDCWTSRARVGTAAKAAITWSALRGSSALQRRLAEDVTGQTLHVQPRAGTTWGTWATWASSAAGGDLGR